MTKISDCIAPAFYQLHQDIKDEKYGEIWLKGGRGSTKSSFVSIEIILGIIKNKDSNAVVVRRYDNELRDSVYGQYKWAASKLGVDHLFRFMVSPMKAVYVPTGQVILFKGADNPLKLKSINIGSGYIKYFHVEETDQFGGFEEIRNILQSLFRGENHKRTAFFSYNPPRSARSWVNRETKIPKDKRFIHTSDYRDVSPEWLGDRFIADAEHLKNTNEVAYRHEYLGEEVGTGLEIFNNVEIREIKAEEIAAFDHIRQGLDFGYAIDPLSFERMHYDAKKRHLFMFREEAGIGLSNRVLASKMSAQEKNETTIADSAEPKSIDELRNDYGLRVIGAKKGPGSVENGVNWLADLEKIVIDPVRCPLAAKEFVNYALETRRDGEVMSRYPDKDNHCLIGETLVMTDRGQIRIDSIMAGDMILTRAGYRSCIKAWKVFDCAPIFSVYTNKRIITGTASHKIFVNGAFTRIDAIRYGDVLLSLRGQSWLDQKLLFLKAIFSFAGRNQSGELTGFITDAIKSRSDCMMQYGNRSTARSISGIISTIKTATLSIMQSRTLNALIQKNTLASIHGATRGSENNQSTLNQFEGLQKNGTHRKPGKHGTENTQKHPYATFRWLKKSAINAESCLIQEGIERRIDSALTRANQSGDGNQESMISNKYAKNARNHSRRTNMRRFAFVPDHVLAVEPAGNAAVYDLTVEGEHEFFANGMLVHNSIDSCRYALERDIGSKTMRAGRTSASVLGL